MKHSLKQAPSRLLGNEEGSAIIIALMFVALMTALGIWATRTANTEAMIAGNEVRMQQTFFDTEGGVVEAAFTIESEDPGLLRDLSPTWLFKEADLPDMTKPDNWDFDGQDGDDTAVASTLNSDIAYTVIDRGSAGGSSMLMTNLTVVHAYSVYSFTSTNRGRELIEVGYKRRF